MRRRTAEQNGGRYVREFAEQMWKGMKMRVLVMSGFVDTKGKVKITL